MRFRQAWFSFKAQRAFFGGLMLLAATAFATPPLLPAVRPTVAPKATPPPAHKAPEPVAVVPKKRPGATPTPAAATVATSTKAKADLEYADAWPSEWRPTPPDLELKPVEAHKGDAFAAFAKGLLAEDNADQDAMLEGYRRALELDPSYAELAVKVAYELARRNDVAAGIQLLKDSIKATPKDPLPYIYLSQLYSLYLKKPDLALTYAEQALTLAPGNFKSYLAVYQLHDSAGQKAKAEAVLAKAIKVDSNDPHYWTELGEFLQKIYLKDDGSCSPDELKRMNTVYQRLTELGKDDAATQSKIADYYVLSKQVKEAVPIYLAVLKMQPANGEPPSGNVREKLARSLIFTGQREEAIAVLEEMVKDNPQRFDTYELLGELYEQKGDLDAAMKNYEHSLLLDSSEPRNHLRLADVLRQAKKFDQAVKMLEEARKKFPDLPFITYELALALSQSKRHEEALATFAQAQADAENRNEELLNASFFFTYGAAAEQAGKLEQAAGLLKQSIQLDPTAAQAYNYLGYMWADRGEHLEEAGNLIKKAVELDPDNGAYLDSLGWFYFKRGENEKALKELLRAQENILREEKKDDAVVLDHIADTYSKLGKIPEALSYWQKAIAIEQEDKTLITRITEKIEAAKQKVTAGTPLPEPSKQ